MMRFDSAMNCNALTCRHENLFSALCHEASFDTHAPVSLIAENGMTTVCHSPSAMKSFLSIEYDMRHGFMSSCSISTKRTSNVCPTFVERRLKEIAPPASISEERSC